jgi:hypothetical protein
MTEAATIWTINKKRAVMKVPGTSLCFQAGVGRQTYYDALDGRYDVQPATIAKLNAALSRFRLAWGGDNGPLALHACYKSALIIAAFEMKADAKAALTSDPSRRATADPEWQRAAQVRQVGYWITNCLLGYRISDIGRAAGVTKQAVSAAIKALMDERDHDQGLNLICERLEEIFA